MSYSGVSIKNAVARVIRLESVCVGDLARIQNPAGDVP